MFTPKIDKSVFRSLQIVQKAHFCLVAIRRAGLTMAGGSHGLTTDEVWLAHPRGDVCEPQSRVRSTLARVGVVGGGSHSCTPYLVWWV